ncbi:hypothetical protein ACIO1C_28975 [Streptomyces sp. NPDC087420]|uniref:effector-associated constant component EACC1 n=1 Tax=Streptomyces sp. NPDC087420 TaxID=3365785 RepID=UPI0038337EAE
MTTGDTESPELELRVSGDDAETHLLALRDWLALEDVLRGRLEMRQSAPEPGHMGVALDVVAVALGSGGAGAVLARSLTTWLIQRRTDVKVSVVAADGRRVEVDVRRAADPERVIAEVVTLLEQSRD